MSDFFSLLHPKMLRFSMALFISAMGSNGIAEENALVVDEALIRPLIQESLEKHPSLQAIRFRIEAAQSSIRALRLWEDPELSLGIVSAEEEKRRDDGDIFLGIDQPLPRLKLHHAEKNIREIEFKAQKALQSIVENEIGLAVAKSALELALADDVLRLQKQEIQWMETLVGVAKERAKNPNVSIVESLRLESELAIRFQKLEAAQRRRTQLAFTLNLLLGRDAEMSWPLLTLPSTTIINPQTLFDENTFSREKLLARLNQENPLLQSLQLQIAIVEAQAEASRAMRQPIFMLGLDSKAYSGGNFREAMLKIKMSLPWINRAVYDAELSRFLAESRAAQGTLSAQTNKLVTELSSLWIEAKNQRLLEKAYAQKVLPKTEKTAESVQNAWTSNKASLLEVLEARNTLLEVRKEQKRAVAAEQSAMQSISALLGRFTGERELGKTFSK